MSINRDTFVDGILRESGGRNVFEARTERYPVFELADAAAERPDVILLPTEPYHFIESDKAEFSVLGDVPAVRDGRIHIVEGELLSWYGPRIARALRELAGLLYRR
jgi:ABC-type Fe3+-hydroxamate transport system substrate-binding protein